MSQTIKDILSASRPPRSQGRGDKYLADLAKGLQKRLLKQQAQYESPTCRLDQDCLAELAVVLVEFAEDMHAGLGLWASVERYQQQFFGTPLPFFVEPSEADSGLSLFDQRRIQCLIWTLMPCFVEGLVINPQHRDLQQMAETAARYLEESFAKMPKDSGVGHFLSTSNTYGWEIKRKLYWLGTGSYLFRLFFQRYMEEHAKTADDRINATDDFLCQECTEWSGLGVTDVLAGTLNLPEKDSTSLTSWYERHNSFFRVEGVKMSGDITETIAVRNVVSGGSYTIRTDMKQSPFEVGLLIQGALTPWRDEWYWSGQQQSYGMAAANLEMSIRRDMLARSSKVAYRFCQPEAEMAQQRASEHHAAFIAHYGDSLVAFRSGLELAAAEQKRLSNGWEKASPEMVAQAMTKGNLDTPRPNMSFPPNILNHEDGIAAFSDPVEGVEYLLDFNDVLSGLRKRGTGLDEAEAEAIRSAMISTVICPAFIRRLVADHGAESIAAACCVMDQPVEFTLEVLLRRFKGEHFRRRMPSIALIF